MAKLRIHRVDGSVLDLAITPLLEYKFEQHKGKGFNAAFRDEEKNSDVYWLAYEAIRLSGSSETLKPFGDEFLMTLKKVEVLDDDPLS